LQVATDIYEKLLDNSGVTEGGDVKIGFKMEAVLESLKEAENLISEIEAQKQSSLLNE